MANNQFDFCDDPEPRCPTVFIVDTSVCMAGKPIKELNGSLQMLKQDLLRDEVQRLRVEVAIVVFGGTVTLVHNFATAYEFNPPMLTVSGNALMGEAIEYALHLVAERKEKYKKGGVRSYRPRFCLITNSYPNGDLYCEEAIQKVHQADTDGEVYFFVVGIKGIDMHQLQRLVYQNRSFIYLEKWFFSDLHSYASRLDDDWFPRDESGEKPLLPTVNWGTI